MPSGQQHSHPPPRPPAVQFSFVLHFGFGGLFAAESLRLCFESEALALEWHNSLKGCIQEELELLGGSGG